MPSYKLTYFGLRGKAEIVRQIFAVAGQEYEDVRIAREDWPALKPTTPFGQLPVLEVDGKPIAQSNAIARYLAKKFGLAGKCDWESAQIDALADQFNDYCAPLRPFFMVVAKMVEGDQNALYKSLVEPARDAFLPLVTKFLKANKSGFLVGDSVSWIDLHIAEHVANFQQFNADYAKNFPEVLAHAEKVHSIPSLKKWIETRPPSPL